MLSTMESQFFLNQPVLDRKDFSSDKPDTVLQMMWGMYQKMLNMQSVMGRVLLKGSRIFLTKQPHNNSIDVDSAVHHTGDDFILGNLKFVPKGKTVKVFGMAILDPLITQAIQQSSYYPKYLEMKMSLEAHQEKGEGEGDDADMERAIKLSLDPAFLPQGQAPVGGVTIRDPVSETTPKLPKVVGKGKAIVTEEQVAHSLIDLSKKKRTTDQFILVRRDQAPHDSTTGPSSQPEDDTSEKVIHESSSTSDSERTESETETVAPKGDQDQGEVDSSTVTSGVSIPVSDPEKAHEALAGPDPEPMQEDQTGSNSGKLHVSLAGPNPEHMDDEFLATAYPKVHENLKLITDERVIEENPESHSGSMSSMKNLDDTFNFGDQFLYDKPTEDDQEKSKVREESDSTIPDSSHQTVTSTPPVIAPFTDVSSSKPSLLVTPPPINTEATTITTSLPEITPFIALQLRVARLEQEISEVKKTDHSADVLASIRSQVPTAVDNYLGTKLDDALLKVLERHTADLIEKYSVLPGPESVKNQESEKSPKEIIRAKKEQGEEKQDSTYSIRSTDKVDLEEFDLKSALFRHMNKIKSANRNTANYRLYHALMEALITDEDAMDKEVADKVKDHKRKHDSDDDEDDDDDEGPSAGSNQGRSTKRRRSDSAASGSAKPPPKDDDQSSKKPRESEASASKQHPALTSTRWQITDTREAGVDSSMHRSDPESEHSEQSSDDISMQDEGNDSDIRRTGKKKLCKADLEGPAFNLVHLSNPEGHQIPQNINEPLPLPLEKDSPGQVTIQPQFFFNKDLDYLLTMPRNRVGDLQLGIESYQTKINIERPNWDAADYYFKEDYTIVSKPRAVVYRDRNDQRKLMRLNELNKFSDGMLTRVMEKLDQMVKDFHLFEYNKGMETRKWSEDDKRRSKDFITAIEKRLQIRRIYRSLESFVGGRIRDIDYRLINRTT
ncbi:hypothetical protein Tco_0494744 [Tanacetum coccineum]